MRSDLIYGRSIEVRNWVAKRLGDPDFGNCQAVGVALGDKLIAGVVFHEWRPQHGVMEVSAAAESPRWASRDNLTELFAYPFDGVGVRMAYARMSEHNMRARKLWRAFGAVETAIPGMRGPTEAEIIATLTREQWHNSRLFNGQEQSANAA